MRLRTDDCSDLYMTNHVWFCKYGGGSSDFLYVHNVLMLFKGFFDVAIMRGMTIQNKP